MTAHLVFTVALATLPLAAVPSPPHHGAAVPRWQLASDTRQQVLQRAVGYTAVPAAVVYRTPLPLMPRHRVRVVVPSSVGGQG